MLAGGGQKGTMVDERPGNYYVSVIDGNRYGLLLGPFPTHRQALDMVEAVRKKAEEIDPRAVFYAFGTCRVEGYNAPGKLNRFFEKG